MSDTSEEREAAVFSAIAQRNRADRAEADANRLQGHLDLVNRYLDCRPYGGIINFNSTCEPGHQCSYHLNEDLEVAEADADRLAEALVALGLDYDGMASGQERQGDGWHYFSCPTRHGFPDCDVKCIAARDALHLHKEQGGKSE